MRRGIRFGIAASAVVLLCVAAVAAGRQSNSKPQPKPSSPASPARQTAEAAQQAKSPGGALTEKSISYEQANAAVDAAMQKAKAIGIKEDIAVVDAGGNLKAFARMDQAWLGSIEIAIRKAKTSRYLDMPTADLAKKAEPGQPLYGIQTIEPTVIFAGGVPIKEADGTIIGAIGCSGSTPDNDNQAATAGAQGVH
jgi:uncharacterized protein GlcG (DUF336 family)